jgi:hypothetical protein
VGSEAFAIIFRRNLHLKKRGTKPGTRAFFLEKIGGIELNEPMILVAESHAVYLLDYKIQSPQAVKNYLK